MSFINDIGKDQKLELWAGKILKKTVEKGERVFVSLSGGRDSMTLLHMLRSLSKKSGFKLSAVHINFGLRGAESERDERFVEEAARKLNVPLVKFREDASKSRKKGEGIQAWARRMRLLRYGELRRRYGGIKIAVAHNLDDQVETFFMRLLRGSGTKGLKGMNLLSRGYLLRPLLGISRAWIDRYIRENGLEFVEDSTNRETFYFRNWVRKNLVPMIERQKRYKDPKRRILNLMNQLSCEDDYLEKRAGIAMKKLNPRREGGEIKFDLKNFRSLPKALRYRVLRKIVKRTGTLRGIDLSHIIDMDRLAMGFSGSKEVSSLPKGLVASRRYGTLSLGFGEAKKGKRFSYSVRPPCVVGVKELGKRIGFSLVKKYEGKRGSKDLYFDLKRFAGTVELRNFRQGDRILLNLDEGPRKVKNIFIGRKIPKYERLYVPLIADKNRVAGIFGVGVDLRYRVTADTKNILKAFEF